jgi:hypothetical protein
MMQGINFGGDGPIMQGTWYNPYTGDAFTVRDAFFEDNQYIVMTTDGRKMDYNRLQNYIQSDMKLEDLKKMKVEKKEKEEIPDEIKNILATNDDLDNEYLIPEDNIYTTKPLGNINEPRHIAPASAHTHAGYATSEPVNMNTTIIEKALKNTTKPQFNVTVSWTDYPERQIEMLKDVMDIPEDEILDWYLDNIEMLEIVEAVKEGIRNRILFKEPPTIEPTTQSVTVENTPVVEEKPIVTVENTPVVTEPTPKKPTAKKAKPTTKNAVKKTPAKKSQPKKS